MNNVEIQHKRILVQLLLKPSVLGVKPDTVPPLSYSPVSHYFDTSTWSLALD